MYTPPTLAEDRDRFIAHYESESGTKITRTPVSWVYLLGVVYAGCAALIHRGILWVYNQIYLRTADMETLENKAEEYGMTRKQGASSVLTLTISGTDGTVFDSGTLWSIGDYVYEQDKDVTLADGTGTATVTCQTSGDEGNQTEGTASTLPSPVAGFTSAVVATTVTEGTDDETEADFRTRIIDRERNKPNGGNAATYITNALEVDGIVKAWATRNSLGTVTVYPLAALTGTSRIPSATKIAEVQTYISDDARRPMCSTAYAAVCTEKAINVTMTGISPADDTTKANIKSALEAYFYAAYPDEYSDDIDSTAVLSVGDIWDCIRSADATATAVEMYVTGIGQATSYTLTIGEIAALGTLTWE